MEKPWLLKFQIQCLFGKNYKNVFIKWPIKYLLYDLSINKPIVSGLNRTDIW